MVLDDKKQRQKLKQLHATLFFPSSTSSFLAPQTPSLLSDIVGWGLGVVLSL